MTKQLSLAAAFVLVAACKTDPPAPSSSSTDNSAPSSVRSAKIDVKPVTPAATQAPGADPPLPPALPPAEPHFKRNRKDINGEMMTDEERAEMMKQRVAQMRQRLDTDGDGKLSVAELAAARGRMRFDNPAAIDTNHDGDISADELAAALQARREQWRQQRNGQVNGDIAPGSGGGNAAPSNSDQ